MKIWQCIKRALKLYSLGYTKDKIVCEDILIKYNGFDTGVSPTTRIVPGTC